MAGTSVEIESVPAAFLSGWKGAFCVTQAAHTFY